MDVERALTPQERLASSRRAITRQLMRRNGRDDVDAGAGNTAGHAIFSGGASWWQIARSAGQAWWQHHPAHTAAEVAAPVVKAYAREKPIRMLGIAAGAGAALMLMRPWRRVWFNRMVSGALGSTELSAIALSLLSRNSNHNKRNQDD